MILAPEVLAILILNSIFLLFALVAFVLSIKIFLRWDMDSTSQRQYHLEKQSFLAATIIKYIFAIKLPLFLFFVFTLDKISTLLTGAMCAAGVLDATDYGSYLLVLKLLNLYLFAFWLTLHYLDIKSPNLPHTRLKFEFFIFAFIFLMMEIVLEGVMFASIDIDKMVSCCGTLYSSSSTSAIAGIFSIDTTILLGIFYGNFLLMALFYWMRQYYWFAIVNLSFMVIALIALIQFFGTYIYELPTHHSPFCFLQGDYYFVGYLLYSLLFLGTFYGMRVALLKLLDREKIRGFGLSLMLNMFYLLLVSAYVIVYFIKNGVWL
jgi:hypothetical protein